MGLSPLSGGHRSRDLRGRGLQGAVECLRVVGPVLAGRDTIKTLVSLPHTQTPEVKRDTLDFPVFTLGLGLDTLVNLGRTRVTLRRLTGFCVSRVFFFLSPVSRIPVTVP